MITHPTAIELLEAVIGWLGQSQAGRSGDDAYFALVSRNALANVARDINPSAADDARAAERLRNLLGCGVTLSAWNGSSPCECGRVPYVRTILRCYDICGRAYSMRWRSISRTAVMSWPFSGRSGCSRNGADASSSSLRCVGKSGDRRQCSACAGHGLEQRKNVRFAGGRPFRYRSAAGPQLERQAHRIGSEDFSG